jgi:hypothetical protein
MHQPNTLPGNVHLVTQWDWSEILLVEVDKYIIGYC